MCHCGDVEDSHPWGYDTLSFGVYFPASQSLMFRQNIRKSHRSNQLPSDPRSPEFSWQ